MTDYKTIFEQRRRNKQAERIELPQAFTTKFPKLKPEKAEKLFRRYLSAVATALAPRLPFLHDGETHVSLAHMLHACSKFEYAKTTYHVWNEFKDIYPFMIVVAKGSNLLAAEHNWEKNTKVKIVNERLLNMLVADQNPEDTFTCLFEGVDLTVDGAVELPIDMENLASYIECTEFELETATNEKHRAKLHRNLWQAVLVYKVGVYTQERCGEGFLPMIPSPSAFGRLYYKGLNIQNVSKQVRSAILGHHFQYDMNAAVFAIKLYLYGKISGGDDVINGTPLGSYTRQYLAEKNAIRKRLAKECYAGILLPSDSAVKNIKNALTAIGFGAKTSGKTWMGPNGIQGTALSDILLAPVARERFLADPFVAAFLAEQRVIEDAILEHAEKEDTYDAMCQAIKDANGVNGRLTRAGKLAYMYQHWEKTVMDDAVDALEHHGVQVVARIHDAFIVKAKLSTAVLDGIRYKWGQRDYLSLDCEEVGEWSQASYKRALRGADAALDEHKQVMERAQLDARMIMVKRQNAGIPADYQAVQSRGNHREAADAQEMIEWVANRNLLASVMRGSEDDGE